MQEKGMMWRFAYGTYEEHRETWLVKDTTPDQFQKDSVQAYVEATRKAIKRGHEDHYEGITKRTGVMTGAKGFNYNGAQIEDIYDSAVKEMEDMGYTRLKEDGDFWPMGWASVLEWDWESDTKHDDTATIRKAIEKAGIPDMEIAAWKDEDD